MNPTNCQPCCSDPTTTNIPGSPGEDGTAGAAGSPGINAFTLVDTAFVVPAKAANVTVTVADSSWMVIGQPVFVEGAGVFSVAAIPSTTSAQLTYLDYDTNVEVGTNIAIGSQISPGGFQEPAPTAPSTAPVTAYAAGTAYTLTATAAQVVFGTTSPVIVIPETGTWLILAGCRIDYNAATFAAVRTVSMKLRRTNNTASDISNAVAALRTQIITTLTFTAGTPQLAAVGYVTANTNDIIQLWGSIDVVPSAGSITVNEAFITAIKLF